MKSEYDEEDILTLNLTLAGVAWGTGLGWKWWGLVGVLVGVVTALVLWCRFKKWNTWEWSDVVARSSLIIGAAVVAGKGQWVALGVLMAGVLVLWGLTRVYRKIRWYKSGKAGLVGLVGGMWWMGAWMGLAKLRIYGVYWAGLSVEQWLATWLLIALVVVIYVRAGRVVSDDWRDIKKLWQKK